MSVEFVYYIFLMLLSYLTIIKVKIFPIFIFFYILFLVLVRVVGFDTDIQHFYNIIKANFYSIFIYKEFAFWLTGRLFYYLTSNGILTFILLDMVWLGIILYSFKKLKNKSLSRSLIAILLVSYPFILGDENLYRQFISLVFVISSYILVNKDKRTSLILAFIALFIHNSAIMFYPLLTLKFFYKRYLKIGFIISNLELLFLFVIIYFMRSGDVSSISKSAANTGLDLRFVYLGIFSSAFYLFIIKFKFKFIKFLKIFPSTYFAIIITIYMSQFSGSAPVERLAMGFLLFFTIDFCTYIENKQYKYKQLLYLLYGIGFSSATILFQSTRNFLFT